MLRNRERYNEYMARYMKTYRKSKPHHVKYLKDLREKAVNILGGPICENCGCDVSSLLEINHIQGNGNTERRHTNRASFLRAIVNGKSDKRLYNILCKICNIHHYVESVLQYKGHTVIWKK